MPTGPWIMLQRWRDLLFAHWSLPPENVRPVVPRELELDLWDGKAWIAVTPFWMSGVRPRGSLPPPLLHTFPELNVRTYVKYKGTPGVYFFSLDAASRLGVWGARTFYHLPYYFASMQIGKEGQAFRYRSTRREGPWPAQFEGRYWPISPPRRWEKGGLEYFLTERYCLYTIYRERVLRAYIHHLPWPLQNADAEIERNTVALADGIQLPAEKPLLHYSRELEVLIWWPELA
jgi:uncharacterized protein YqjF (DUF2071 family)